MNDDERRQAEERVEGPGGGWLARNIMDLLGEAAYRAGLIAERGQGGRMQVDVVWEITPDGLAPEGSPWAGQPCGRADVTPVAVAYPLRSGDEIETARREAKALVEWQRERIRAFDDEGQP